jgi:cysteine-rich repeat protein
VEDKNAKPGPTNEACALSLIREGMRTLIRRDVQATANQSVIDAISSIDGKFTEPLPLIVCGDGVLDAGESCDDGNTVGGDGCSATCETE